MTFCTTLEERLIITKGGGKPTPSGVGVSDDKEIERIKSSNNKLISSMGI